MPLTHTNQVISWNLLVLTNSLVPVPKKTLKFPVFPTVVCVVTKWAISFSFHFYATAGEQARGAYGSSLTTRALFNTPLTKPICYFPQVPEHISQLLSTGRLVHQRVVTVL